MKYCPRSRRHKHVVRSIFVADTELFTEGQWRPASYRQVLQKWCAMMERTSIFYVPPEEEIRWCNVKGTRWPNPCQHSIQEVPGEMQCTNTEAICLSGTAYNEETLLPKPAWGIPSTTPFTVRSVKDGDQIVCRVVTAQNVLNLVVSFIPSITEFGSLLPPYFTVISVKMSGHTVSSFVCWT